MKCPDGPVDQPAHRRPPRGGRGLKLIHNRLRELAAKVAPREGGVD